MDSATGCRKLSTLLRNFGYMSHSTSSTCPALFANVFNQASICIQLSVLKINTLYRFLHTTVYCQPNLKRTIDDIIPKSTTLCWPRHSLETGRSFRYVAKRVGVLELVDHGWRGRNI